MITSFSGEFRCPNGWVIHADQCFLVNVTRRVTWHQARQICVDSNGTLVQIKDQETQKFFKSN